MITSITQLIAMMREQNPYERFPLISDYQTLTKAVIARELNDEIKYIEDLLKLQEVDAIKLKFHSHCKSRAKYNDGTSLSFLANPNLACNKFYFELAKILYPDATFQAIFTILQPEVITQWRVEMVIQREAGGQSKSKASIQFKLNSLPIIAEDSQLSVLPLVVDSFKRLVIVNQVVFALDEIEALDFNLHRSFYRLLSSDDRYMPLREAIAAHSSSLRQLYYTLNFLDGAGATLREFITSVAVDMAESGKRASSGLYAKDVGARATDSLIEYHANLPIDLREALDQCNNGESFNFATVIRHIKEAQCIEYLADRLQEILCNPQNELLLKRSPQLSDAEKQALITPYMSIPRGEAIVNLEGTLPVSTLPQDISKHFYKKITMYELDDWISYLIDFPPEEYAQLIRFAQVESSLGAGLTPIFEALNEIQQRGLIKAMLLHWKKRDVSDRSILHWAVNSTQWLPLFFAAIPKENLLEYLLDQDKDGRSVMHFASANIDVVRLIFASLPVRDHLSVIKSYDNRECGVLYWSTNQPNVLRELLQVYPPEDRIAAIMEANIEGENVLMQSLNHARSFRNLLQLYPLSERLEAIQSRDSDGASILSKATIDPKLIRIILSQLPESDRVVALRDRYDDKSVMQLIAVNTKYSKFWPKLLSMLPEEVRAELLQDRDEEGYSILHLVADDARLLSLILNLLPEHERLDAVLNQNNSGNNVFHLAAKYKNSVIAIVEALQESERQTAIMALDINGNSAVHWAAYSPKGLQQLLLLYPPDERLGIVKACNYYGENILLWAVQEIPKSFYLILFLLPEMDRFRVLNERDSSGRSILNFAENKPALIWMILHLILEEQRMQVIQLPIDEKGSCVLHLAAQEIKTLLGILAFIPKRDWGNALDVRDNEGGSVLSKVPTNMRISFVQEMVSELGLEECEQIKHHTALLNSVSSGFQAGIIRAMDAHLAILRTIVTPSLHRFFATAAVDTTIQLPQLKRARLARPQEQDQQRDEANQQQRQHPH